MILTIQTNEIVVVAAVIAAVIAVLNAVIYVLFKTRNSTIRNLITDWVYRLLWQIKEIYLHGLDRTPPSSFEYFNSRALDLINSEDYQTKPDLERQDIANMVANKEYVHYYFVKCGTFTVEVYRDMLEDYRTGAYNTKAYSTWAHLKEILPIEISSSKGAFGDFMKFVNIGWFDSEGMFIIKNQISKDEDQEFRNYPKNHQYIGRAIYWICHRNGISCPERVFSKLWKIPEKTIKEWIRKNQNISITDQIDDIIFAILKQ